MSVPTIKLAVAISVYLDQKTLESVSVRMATGYTQMELPVLTVNVVLKQLVILNLIALF